MANTTIDPVHLLGSAFSAIVSIWASVTQIRDRWPAEEFNTLALYIEDMLQALKDEVKAGRGWSTEDPISVHHLQKLLVFVRDSDIRPFVF
jgi:hypothetical protein